MLNRQNSTRSPLASESSSSGIPSASGIAEASEPAAALPGTEIDPLAIASPEDLPLMVLARLTDGILVFDHEWRIIFANDEGRRIGKLTPADFNSRTHWEIYPMTVGSPLETAFRQCMASRVASRFEFFFPPTDIWVDARLLPLPTGMAVQYRDITPQKSAEARFLQQRELITFVQNSARIAFWTVDLATRSLTFDPGSYPVYGHPFSSLPSLDHLRAIYHPDDEQRITDQARQAIETGELVVVEFRVFDPKGNIIWLEARAQTTLVDGKPVALGGMTIDITERRRGQEELAASEQRYRVLTELSPHFIWTADPDGHITYANQGFLDYLGLSLEEITENWLSPFDPLDYGLAKTVWLHSIVTGQDLELEARLLDHAGESRWWLIRAKPLREQPNPAGVLDLEAPSAPGPILNWFGVALDIHDRKTAADALSQKHLETERQRAEIEAVYQTAPIGLALFDPTHFRYLRLNDRQAEIVGLPKSQILGRTVTDIAPIPGLREMFEEVARGKPIRNALLHGELPSRPGEQRFWNVNYFPVYNSDGSIHAISAASLEITNQKKAETALLQSEKLAAVGRLASSISHEINNPLEAVTNLLYLIQHSDHLPEDLRLYIDTAQSELQRVCQIATQTLRFHRQAARATLVTPQDLIEAVVHLYQGRLTNSRIEVVPLYRNTRRILCFENDIRQVLNNLIANAIDAMRHGGTLHVRAHDATDFTPYIPINPIAHPATGNPAWPVLASQSATDAGSATPLDPTPTPQPRRGIRITIADTGYGISPATRARLFEPFYTTKDLNGTGLGLWISRGIVARHHGRISLRSSENPRHHGSVFTVFLPHILESEIEESNPHPL